MAYCTTADLLLGQISNTLPPTVDPLDYIDNAADEIDARLGFIYQTPFDIEGANSLPEYQVKLLKSINAKRASGRIIMAVAVGTQETSLHAYALRLLQEADLELAAIANGDVRLSAPLVDSEGNVYGPAPDPDNEDPYARVPGAVNHDAYSAVGAFEANIMQGQDAAWSPGDGSRTYFYYPYHKHSGG